MAHALGVQEEATRAPHDGELATLHIDLHEQDGLLMMEGGRLQIDHHRYCAVLGPKDNYPCQRYSGGSAQQVDRTKVNYMNGGYHYYIRWLA